MTTQKSDHIVAYQGEPGAHSHLACLTALPDWQLLPCPTFEDVFAAVTEGRARRAMLPVENSLAGRVADIHHLLPSSGLYIVGEHFERVRHQLLARPDAELSDLKTVHSHTMALGQCRDVVHELGLRPVTEADTAGSARMVAESVDVSRAAIASELAARVHGLKIVRQDVEDAEHNTTRFLVVASDPDEAALEDGHVVTTFVFRVRNVPAALYKALGGFATNGVNMTKLESYQLEGSFMATQFYADIEGHPSTRSVELAMEELDFYTSEVKILGVYKASAFRTALKDAD